MSPFGQPRADIPPEHLTRGSAIHREALSLLDGRHGRDFQFRPSRVDPLRRLKMGFVLRQRHFPARLANYLLYRAERGRLPVVHYFPPTVAVESDAACNLRCPGCSTGVKAKAPAGHRTERSILEAVVDQSFERAFQVSFHQQGEPLLNPAFFGACARAVDKGLWTTIHTNLSLKAPYLAEQIVAARLCNLVVSCDGATQEVYEQYRRGGDLDLVLRNLRSITREKARLRTPFPWVTAKFIVFDHNWHEMAAFRSLALSAGADDVLFVAGFSEGVYATGRGATENEWSLADLAWRPRQLPPRCMDVWDGLNVTPRGVVSPCCYAIESHGFVPAGGPVPSLQAAWNHESYVRMRRHFLGERVERASMPRPCDTCEFTRPPVPGRA